MTHQHDEDDRIAVRDHGRLQHGSTGLATTGHRLRRDDRRLITFLPGEPTAELVVETWSSATTTSEPDETFTVTIRGPRSTERSAAPSERHGHDRRRRRGARPRARGPLDVRHDADGRIDRLVAEFNKPLRRRCANTACDPFPTQPGGISVQSVTVCGDTATINLAEGQASTPRTPTSRCSWPAAVRSATSAATTSTFGHAARTTWPRRLLVESPTTTTALTARRKEGSIRRLVSSSRSASLSPDHARRHAARTCSLGDPAAERERDTIAAPNLLSGDILAHLASNNYLGVSSNAATSSGLTVVWLTNADRTIRLTLTRATTPALVRNLEQAA